MSKWLYQGRYLKEPPENSYGFIYLITCLDNSDLFGHFYVGQKAFNSIRTKTLSKKGSLEAWSGRGPKPKKTKVTSSSNWEIYNSSSKEVQALIVDLGEDKFKFEILEFAKNKSELAYLEAKWIIEKRCLLVDNCFNQWLSVKIRRNNLR